VPRPGQGIQAFARCTDGVSVAGPQRVTRGRWYYAGGGALSPRGEAQSGLLNGGVVGRRHVAGAAVKGTTVPSWTGRSPSSECTEMGDGAASAGPWDGCPAHIWHKLGWSQGPAPASQQQPSVCNAAEMLAGDAAQTWIAGRLTVERKRTKVVSRAASRIMIPVG